VRSLKEQPRWFDKPGVAVNAINWPVLVAELGMQTKVAKSHSYTHLAGPYPWELGTMRQAGSHHISRVAFTRPVRTNGYPFSSRPDNV